MVKLRGMNGALVIQASIGKPNKTVENWPYELADDHPIPSTVWVRNWQVKLESYLWSCRESADMIYSGSWMVLVHFFDQTLLIDHTSDI